MSGGGWEKSVARRAAVRVLALGALLPFAEFGVPARAARTARRALAVPVGTFELQRDLTRELGGGAAIVVTRRWRIDFTRGNTGMIVTGEQIFADVAAPSALSTLASIERSRSPTELFPLDLDRAGLIRDSRQSPGDASLVRALETGRMLLRTLPIPSADRDDARQFMLQLETLGASAVSRLPVDLFFPEPGAETNTRALALPGGRQGSLVVTASARADPESGLLIASERRVATRLETSERAAAERWTLTSI